MCIMGLVKPFLEIDNDYIYLRVKKNDWDKYHDCIDSIKALIKKHKPIPEKLFIEYLSYVENENIEWSHHYSFYKSQVYDKVMLYFENKNPQYHFTYTYDSGFPMFTTQTETLEVLIRYVIASIINTYSSQVMENKDDLIYNKNILCYLIDKIQEYLDRSPESPNKPTYSKRMVYILAGYILLGFDYHLFEKNIKITNPKVFYKVRDTIKYKKKTS